MNFETPQAIEFKQKLAELDRENILEIIEQQSPDYIKDINRVEWVFRNKLSHLSDSQGNPITERDFTKEELIRLVDPPFFFSRDMMRQGFNEDDQRQIHIASDPVLWNKQILNATPRAYQALVMRDMNDQVVLRWGRRLGKALSLDTVIPTIDGYKTMADIQVGEVVFDENGDPCNVTDATEVQVDRTCYLVKFSDGTEVVADADHTWSVHDANDRSSISIGVPRALQNLTTEQMKDSVSHYSGDIKEHNYSVPLAGALSFPERNLVMNPWVYGFMIVNGYQDSNCVKIIEKDHDEITRKFRSLGYRIENIKGNKFKVPDINPDDYDKFEIKDEYLIASEDQRLDLLCGICDARGSVVNELVEISLTSQQFIEDVHQLLTSLGHSGRRQEKRNKKNGEYYGTNYKLVFSTDPKFFSLTRKQVEPTERLRKKSPIRMITEITEVSSVPVKCIAVDSRSRLFLASRSHVPTHNSFFLSMYIIWYAFVHPKARILVMAPAKTQVGLLYEQVLELAEESPIVKNAITKKPRSPQYEIWFTNQSSVKLFTTGFKSGSKSDGARGQEADMIVLDEMDYMGPEDLVALMAMLQETDASKVFSKKLIGASTPTGQRSTYWRWNTDPQYNFSSYFFPSYVNPLWNQTEEEKARLRYRNEQHYRHEIEADWGEDAEGVYPRKYVDLAFNTGSVGDYDNFRPDPQNKIYTLGVDWDKHGAGVNMVILEGHVNNTMGHPIRAVYREEVIKGDFTYIEAVDHIVKLDSIYNFDHVYIDQGAGEVQAEMLHKYGLENPHTRLHIKTKACHFSNIVEVRDPYTKQINKKRLKPFMIDNLVYQLEQKNLQFNSDDDELYLQLISYIKIRETESGNPVYAPGGETVDHAHDALILALFAFAENYDDLFSLGEPQAPRGISNSFFMPSSDNQVTKEKVESTKSKESNAPAPSSIYAPKGKSIKSGGRGRPAIKRSSF